MLGNSSCMRTSFILFENTTLNTDHEWQHNWFNHQSDIYICNQGAWDNDESALAVIGNCSTDHNSWRKSSVSTPQTAWFQALTWPPFIEYTAITGTQTERAAIGTAAIKDLHSALQ
ncbi:hypothetical protein AVEN_127879-1 [Araneus ventricosus]|uniref:Uncharacterized protein n=1 Tax=Araneus ventricosus TaxID=182803 RepID=A0A4Y1ZZT1_ARAVE|nr:hypothetical protein AVEN_127879-1 [Araneus ventricosus]